MEHFESISDIDNIDRREVIQVSSSCSRDVKQVVEKMEQTKRKNKEAEATMINRKDKNNKQLRPHFQIDWRQLSYYQKPKSLLARIGNKLTSSSNDDSFDSASHVSFNQNDSGKRILNNLDGCFKSGQLSAILGPSGAGKSTFLATLFGSKHEGAYGRTKVTWFTDDPNQAKRRPMRIAVLPQHDHLLHHLSVYECMMFASKIKNASREIVGKNFHRQNVKRVAKMLKLSDCLNTRCGKLSGGQYKRVSIGQELLSEPDVIILDEPTSGLDAMTCLTTIQTLKSIVMKQPISIILTIHQPDMDVFNLFDKIYVIAQGGTCIYEGPPERVMPTLAEVGLKPPIATYNPARFIVENAFIDPKVHQYSMAEFMSNAESSTDDYCSSFEESSEDEEQSEMKDKQQNYFKRSITNLTDTIVNRQNIDTRASKRPLLNIGIQTLDGKLITSEQIAKNKEDLEQSERWELLMKLNHLQRSKYSNQQQDCGDTTNCEDIIISQMEPLTNNDDAASTSSVSEHSLESVSKYEKPSSIKSDYSSSGWSERKGFDSNGFLKVTKASSLALIPAKNNLSNKKQSSSSRSLDMSINKVDNLNIKQLDEESSISSEENEKFVVTFRDDVTPNSKSSTGSRIKMKRNFDKQLSAKHYCKKQNNYPIWYHTYLLTHRTWLSIIRDPVFFGIQACMHTMIPVILALIFGSVQEEGCPRVGDFDLVDFAYSDSDNLIQGTVSSIRQSIGNIGIVFFEMFVLSFSINCITALVFPLDMYVLLKEYRNGWYSMRSYFFGRTLADLPIPVVLHSIGIAILYFLTGQPQSLWRFTLITILVILQSLVAQSVGLTIGALLMKSSQSAVLAAAGIVAPFFALSGFIVRVHTLPIVAQIVAKASYLYHVLNGFIILRYGFGRCACRNEDFEQANLHPIPPNLHTMASIWIGTYSNEYTGSSVMATANKTNVDPNIDVVDKMMNAFKMANSYGHQIDSCDDVLPYAMLDFNLRDQDIYACFYMLIIMLIVSRIITFSSIYYKIRSFA